jgi:hypothetical protein
MLKYWALAAKAWGRTCASADVELFHHTANRLLADSELLSNLGLAPVVPTD